MTEEVAEEDAIAQQLAINTVVAMFQTCAVVGALREQGLVDPMKVAAWADAFAQGFMGASRRELEIASPVSCEGLLTP